MTYIDQLKKHKTLIESAMDLNDPSKSLLPVKKVQKKATKKRTFNFYWNISENCPASEFEKDKKVDWKQTVTTSPEIRIIFDYPIANPATLKFKRSSGWRLVDICKAVTRGYEKIYREEDASLAAAPDEGKYGIYGHDIGDLFLGSITEVKPNVFKLGVDS